MTVDSTVNWAVQTSIAISILIVIILIIRRPITRAFGANTAYALWLLPLLRLFMPSIIVTKTPKPVPSFTPEIQASTPILPELSFPSAMPIEIYTQPMGLNINLGIVCLWLGIAVIWFTVQIIRHMRQVKHMRINSMPITPNFMAVIADAMTKTDLSIIPEIRISDNDIGPLVSGITKPIIILPHNFEKQF